MKQRSRPKLVIFEPPSVNEKSGAATILFTFFSILPASRFLCIRIHIVE